jgi:hypothetical protein
VLPDIAQKYSLVEPRLNRWSLSGNWIVGGEQARLDQANGAIAHRFSGRDLHLVPGPD